MRTSALVLLAALAIPFLGSCVSKKKYKKLRASNETLINRMDSLRTGLELCGYDKDELEETVSALRVMNQELRVNNASSLEIMKNMTQNMDKTLEGLREKDVQIRRLYEAKSARDSTTLALMASLKGSLGNMDDKDIEINVEKGVVFISISDKLLFQSGSTTISGDAGAVLGKVATVVNARPDLDFLVEGHTDDVPIHRDGMKDNWDLSVLRAASIVRALQKDHGIDPARMTACGRGQYIPIAPNDTPENKAKNRRTRIVVLPKLDQFSKLIEEGFEELKKEE